MKTPIYIESLVTKGIGDHNSVSNGPDDGANNGLAACFWNCMRHGTTQEAMNNFLSRLPALYEVSESTTGTKVTGAGFLNIGGHGNEGLLETGVGQHGSWDNTKYLTVWNAYAWRTELQRLAGKNFPQMFIWSCHTGAGERGADLLFEMAVAMQHPVSGRSGFTYTNGKKIWFEPNSVWVTATPTQRPTPVDAPTPHFVGTEAMVCIVNSKGGTQEAGSSTIRSIKVEKSATPFSAKKAAATLSGTDGREFGNLIFSSEPERLPGAPMAFVTAWLVVVFDDAGSLFEAKFSVFNNRLVVQDNADFGYRLSASAQFALEQL